MAAGIQLPGGGETIDLQQQVARLQALLEASRQVHSTIHENEVLEQVLRIVVRELEMDGAAFPSAGLVYGDQPTADNGTVLSWPLDDRAGKRLTELVVAPPGGRELTIYESDFIEGLALQAAVALENARYHKRNVEFARVQQDLAQIAEVVTGIGRVASFGGRVPIARDGEGAQIKDRCWCASSGEGIASHIGPFKELIAAVEVLKGIWLSFYPGAKIGVLGGNGAGKSTLLRIMAGVDKDFDGTARPYSKATIGFVQQEPQLVVDIRK